LKNKILITGSNGLLGMQLRCLLEKNDFSVIASGIGSDRLTNHNHIYIELDVTSSERCEYILNTYQPDIIVNAAAMTDVDKCEKEKERCLEVNSDSIDAFIPYLKKNNTHYIQISTDFIFNGEKGPYIETDDCDPINFYGFSKLEAEKKITTNNLKYTILRTSLIYGMDNDGNNFLMWVRKNLMDNVELNIVDDQYRTPTYVLDLSAAILEIVKHKKYGTYHISGGENLSIFEIVCNIAKHYKLSISLVNRIKSSELNQIAKRPSRSGLKIKKAIENFNFTPTDLNNALNQIL